MSLCERSVRIRNPVNRNRHTSVLTPLTSLWKHASDGLHLCKEAWPVCVWRLVCQCREVIDTLAFGTSAKNWCLESVLPLPIPGIASLPALKPRRHHDVVTHPQKGDRDASNTPPKKVTETRRDHMRSSPHATRASQTSSGTIHATNSWSALPVSVRKQVCQVTMDPRQKPTETDSANHPNIWLALVGPALLECSSWRKRGNSRWIILKSNTRSNSANPRWTDAPCERSVRIRNPVNRNRHTSVLTPLTSLWKHASDGLHLCKEAWPVCVWRLVCQCREVIDTLAFGTSAKNWCLESVLPLPIPGIVIVAGPKTTETPRRGYTWNVIVWMNLRLKVITN